MSASSSKPPRPPQHQLHLHVGNTSATATNDDDSGDCPGAASESSSSSSSDDNAKRPTPTPAPGGSGGGSWYPACAACKHQRRKCTRDCPLAPYFPADQKRRFNNAHRLFGVRNIQKTLDRVSPEVAPEAMHALIYESEARAADPVGGCVGIIEELRRQIDTTQMHLHHVRQQIAIHRAATAAAPPAAAPAPNDTAAMAGQRQDNMAAAVGALYAAGQQQPIPYGGGSGLIFHDHQDYNHAFKVEEQNYRDQQLYHYFGYSNGGAGGGAAATSEDGGMQQQQLLLQYGFANVVDGSGVKGGSPVAHLGEQLDMKTQLLPPATMQHYSPAAAGDVLHPEQEKHDDVDEHMEEQQAPAGAPCHLELGFSSFLSD